MSTVIPPLQVTGPECVFVHACVKVSVSRAMAWIELFMKHVYSFCFTRVLSHLPLYMPAPTTPQFSSVFIHPVLLWPCCWVLTDIRSHEMSACIDTVKHDCLFHVHIIFYTCHLCSAIKRSTRGHLNKEIFIICSHEWICLSEQHRVA